MIPADVLASPRQRERYSAGTVSSNCYVQLISGAPNLGQNLSAMGLCSVPLAVQNLSNLRNSDAHYLLESSIIQHRHELLSRCDVQHRPFIRSEGSNNFTLELSRLHRQSEGAFFPVLPHYREAALTSGDCVLVET